MSCPRCEADSHRFYQLSVTVNGRAFDQVEICPYYETKHKDITDQKILTLVQLLDGQFFVVQLRNGEKEFFEINLEDEDKAYRLIWFLQDGSLIVGVINCYRKG